MKKFEEIFPRGLIVSCQAREGEPLYSSDIMARMARCAELGGAIGLRANTPQDILAIKQTVSLPLIGIYKIPTRGYEVYITPTFDAARALVQAGADVIAADATDRARPNGETIASLFRKIHDELDRPVMADCSTFEEGMKARDLGADAVATTLAGYTPHSISQEGPDYALLERLAQTLDVPVIGEGRFFFPEQAARALEIGAYAVVVGTAITRPQDITARFVKSMNKILQGKGGKLS